MKHGLRLLGVLSMISISSLCGAQEIIISKSQITSFSLISEQGGIQLESSLGQLSISTLSQEELMLTQGFHQCYPELTPSEILNVMLNEQIAIHVYPNPTVDNVHIEAGYEDLKSYQVFDMTGRVMLSGKLLPKQKQEVDMSSLRLGTYLLVLLDSREELLGQERIQKL